jgi:crotonobetainyl-CoA:carnitine CoA-transferase CaiB-like acyl-CoA transferase
MTEKTKDLPRKALNGLKIVDLSRVLGGPFATQLLADHGANVIKVEPPQGDEVRDWGPPFHDEDAAYFLGINRNKKSIGLDLTKEQGRKVLLALLKDADVLIENFKPGTMEGWGIGYAELSKVFPRLIYCKISGFGSDGPLGGFPGYDGVVGAMVGHCSVTGSQESGPTRLGLPVVDISTGLYCVNGILLAVIERFASGRGQSIEVTLYDAAMSLMHPHFTNFFMSGQVPVRTGNQHASLVPYGMFPTRTVPVMLGVGNNNAFRKLAEAIGRPDLATDTRFATNGDRQQNRAALNEIITNQLHGVDGEAFALKLLGAGLVCGPVLDTRQAIESEHTKARGIIYEDGWYRGIGTPIRLGRTPGGLTSLPPKFSQHADEILSDHGFEDDDVILLRESGVVLSRRRA